MAVAGGWLSDFDHETTVTRLLLERVPEDALEWRPHEKSFTLGGLAAHLTQIPHWGTTILDQSRYDLSGGGAPRPTAASRAEILTAFDRTVHEVRRAFQQKSDAELTAPWTLAKDGKPLLTMPRIAALRRFVIHHLVHHRGQLTVYLRLRGVPIPPLYGPTADERP
jgi:uncharacterized damage-inducible protein DinB